MGSLLAWLLYAPFNPLSPSLIRIGGWILIGVAVGLTDGLTWWRHSLEAGNPRRFRQRIISSLSIGICISLLAAIGFEYLRTNFTEIPTWLMRFEDPVGFAMLGGLLGLGLGFVGSPSYQVALRAGGGFEYVSKPKLKPSPESQNSSTNGYQETPRPIILSPLSFVISDDDQEEIEEGLSIRLPTRGKIVIGSNSNANIQLPGLPPSPG
ncbi:MAG: hypothetical protein HC924_13535 [Synechococcaceae cyanobacterium SM2_3_2]|nr:hypothetical protein [Synechococcaceae cyanobacterium SM2_3_2]